MYDTLQNFETLTGSRIDREKGVIHGVSVVETGEAKGHGVWIDKLTLQTVIEAAQKFSEGLKVKFRHGKSGEYQNVLEETFGLLKNFVIDGHKVRADLHLLDSLSADIRSKAFEMAEKMSAQFGLSIVFTGTNEKIDGRSYLRCTGLQSTDLTDKPAATSGLFSMDKAIKYENDKDGAHAKHCMCDECESKSSTKKMEAFETALSALNTTVNQLVAKIDTKPSAASNPAATMLEVKLADGTTKNLSGSDILTRLEAADKLVADAKKTVEANERASLIKGIVADGRVIFKDDNTAYKLEELQALDVAFLKFAAKNAPQLATQAKLTYSGTGGPGAIKAFTKKDATGKDIPMTGDELTTTAWEAAGYDDIDKMIAKSMNPNSN